MSLRDAFVYTITALPEDTDPADMFASGGDDALDAETVAKIRSDSEWNTWAWCVVKVTATHPDIDGVEGVDYLGGCSYRDEAEFRAGGYYEDMIQVAADDLAHKLETVRRVLCPNHAAAAAEA